MAVEVGALTGGPVVALHTDYVMSGNVALVLGFESVVDVSEQSPTEELELHEQT